MWKATENQFVDEMNFTSDSSSHYHSLYPECATPEMHPLWPELSRADWTTHLLMSLIGHREPWGTQDLEHMNTSLVWQLPWPCTDGLWGHLNPTPERWYDRVHQWVVTWQCLVAIRISFEVWGICKCRTWEMKFDIWYCQAPRCHIIRIRCSWLSS